jgi:hypothetical protein
MNSKNSTNDREDKDTNKPFRVRLFWTIACGAFCGSILGTAAAVIVWVMSL